MEELVVGMDELPSRTLKAKFLDLLECDESSLEGLAKVFRIDITRYATVRELVDSQERRFGQLSLDKWKYMLKQLGHFEYFQQHVVANQFIADVTDIEDLNDKSSLAAKQWPRNDCVARGPARGLPAGNQLRVEHKSVECKSKKIRPKKFEELKVTPMSEGTVVEIAKSYQPSRKWPEWSLPPPEESAVKENSVDDAAKGDCNSTLEAAIKSDFFSGEGTSHENNKMPCNSKSLSHDGENGTSQFENAAIAETPPSSLQAESKQQSHETPSRPTTPEAPRSSHDPLVTGQQRSCKSNTVAQTHPPEDEECGLTNISQETGNPAEQYDDSENNGLLTELQKEIESLQLKVSFLVGELQKKSSCCASLQTKCQLLYQQLEVSRDECAQLQVTVEELRRLFDQSAVLEAESQQLIRMTQEMYLWKEQQCNRLEEHIRQIDQRYDNTNYHMENLNRENQEMSEELRLSVGEVRDFLQHREEHLRGERERLRLDSERRLEERLEEAGRAFDSAETDKVKRVKQKLAREKCKRKEIEEKSKTLREENRRLWALVRQMKSKEVGGVTSGCSCDDLSSNTASSEADRPDDEQPGTSNHNQQSDSDDSSEDELFEDARDEFYFP